MSVRAENRYKAFAAREAAARLPSHNEVFLRDLNATPRDANTRAPFGPIHFVSGHGGWWAECPTTGYGYWYRTIRQAVGAWRVAVFLENGVLVGHPA